MGRTAGYWRSRSDKEIIDAVHTIETYSEEDQEAICTEAAQRRAREGYPLEIPESTRTGSVDSGAGSNKTSTTRILSETGKIIVGAIATIAALAIYLWARSHSPHMGFGELITKLDSYIIKEHIYSLIVLVAASIGLFGVICIVLGLKGAKTGAAHIERIE